MYLRIGNVFLYYKEVIYEDFIWSADRKVRIKGYGTVYVTVNTSPEFKSIRINETVYYPTFIYNMILLDYLKDKGY